MSDSLTLGTSVGLTEGVAVGFTDGVADGANVARVGEPVGWAVNIVDPVGGCVGADVQASQLAGHAALVLLPQPRNSTKVGHSAGSRTSPHAGTAVFVVCVAVGALVAALSGVVRESSMHINAETTGARILPQGSR